jgi:hypothetical protein
MPQLNSVFQKMAESALSELPPIPFLMEISDVTHAFQMWNARSITSEQLLLIVNGLRGNTFADLKNFPYFPVLFSKENPVAPKADAGTIASILRKVPPFNRFITVVGDQDDNDDSGSPEGEELWFPRQRKLSRKMSYPALAIFEHFVKMESIGYSAESCPAVFYYWPELFQDLQTSPFEIIRRRFSILESEVNRNYLKVWIGYNFSLERKWRLDDDVATLPDFGVPHIGHADVFHVSQQLTETCPSSSSFVFIDGEIKIRDRPVARIDSRHEIRIDRSSLTLSIVQVRKNKTIFKMVESALVFATSLSLSSNGLFFIIDFEFGLTHCYRMHYAKNKPNGIRFLVDFSWAAKPKSSVSGVHGLIASAVGPQLVLWNIFSGTIHRVLDFEESITAVAFDEESGIWATTPSCGRFVSVNGKILAEIRLTEKVTVIASLTVDSPRRPRAAIVGTSSGSLFVLEAKLDGGVVDSKRLPSQHRHPIENIVVHPSMKAFVSVDKERMSFMWTAPVVSGQIVPAGVYAKCHACDAEASGTCPSCGRAVCGQCLAPRPDVRCAFCVAFAWM